MSPSRRSASKSRNWRRSSTNSCSIVCRAPSVLTEAGRSLLGYARQILTGIADARRSVAALEQEVAGEALGRRDSIDRALRVAAAHPASFSSAIRR